MSNVHDFQERLSWSEKASDEPFWDAVYRKAFPNMVRHMMGSGNTESQRLGVDRVILLANNHIIRIDEKKREKVYSDIILEYVSVDKTNAPGWIEKDLAIDYIAYAFMPIKQVHLFPFQLLRLAWIANKDEWLQKHRKIEAANKGYKTLSLAVPINVLRESMIRSSVIDVSAEYVPFVVSKDHKVSFWKDVNPKREKFTELKIKEVANRLQISPENLTLIIKEICHENKMEARYSITDPDIVMVMRIDAPKISQQPSGGESKSGGQ